jgi:hypothetical protein
MGYAKTAIADVYKDTGHAVLLSFPESEQGHSVCFRPASCH